MTTINIGIVAHVDAGKTSLTERILFETHVVAEPGRVDQGTTQTDSLDLERQRGITIKASVVSFFIDSLKVNLIDTPGHADFLAEVERSLRVLDAAILVISAVEGLQAQTSILYAALKKLAIPTIIFINKIDRRGAQAETLLQRIKEKLNAQIIPLSHVAHIGTRDARITPCTLSDTAFLQACIEQLTLHDEQLLAAYVEGQTITAEQARTALLQQVGQCRLSPVFFGSAIMGVGVTELLANLGSYVPSTSDQHEKPLSGLAFKLEKAANGERVAYVRLFSGRMCVKDAVNLLRRVQGGETEMLRGKIQQLQLFRAGETVPIHQVEAGEICKVFGWKGVRIGDIVGENSEHIKSLRFATPHLEIGISAREQEQNRQLYQALLELAEEDPLIFVLKDEVHQSIYLRMFGEVQKEVIESTLKEQYGLAVCFSETSIICTEKPRGIGQALEKMGVSGNPFIATVGLQVEPGPEGSGITYRSPSGALPLSFYRAIEETVYATLTQGLYGWEVTDIIVTVTQTAYSSVASTAGDFRNLVPLVLMEALTQAGTDLYEPINQFELRVPDAMISTAMFKLAHLRAAYEQPVPHGDTFSLQGTIPVETTEQFRHELPAFTEGEGVFLTQEAGYRKKAGDHPTRKRMDHNPLNRKEYLLYIQRVY